MTKRKRSPFVKLLLALLGMVALGAVALAVFIATLNISAYRDRIEARFSQTLGREVRLEGPMALEIGLTPRFVVENIAVSNAAWGSAPLFASAERAEIAVSLPALLQRHLKITDLRATGARVNLERDADGQANWAFDLPAPKLTKEIMSVDVRELAITYREPDEAPEKFTIEAMDAALAADAPVRVALRGGYEGVPVEVQLDGGTLASLSAGASPWVVKGTARLGSAEFRIQGRLFDGLGTRHAAVAATGKGRGLPERAPLVGTPLPKVGDWSLEGRAELSREYVQIQVSLAVEKLALTPALQELAIAEVAELEQFSMTVSGKGAGLGDWIGQSRWRLDASGGRFRSEQLSVTVQKASGTVDPEGPAELSVDGTVNGEPLSLAGLAGPLKNLVQSPRSSPLSVTLEAGELQGRFSGSYFSGVVEGGLRLNAPDLHSLAPLTDQSWPKAGPVRLSGNLRYQQGSLRVSGLDATIGQSRIAGSGEILASDPLRVQATLDSGVLQLDELRAMAEAAPGSPAPAEPEATSERLVPELPLSALPPAHLNLELRFDELQLRDQSETVGRLSGRLFMDPKRARLESLTGKVFGARLSGRFDLNTGVSPGEVAFATEVEDIDYGNLLETLDVTDKVKGTIDLSADVTGRGDDLRSVLDSARGTLGFVGDEGRVPRALLELWGGSVLQLFNPVSWAEGNTVKINCGVGHFTIEDGIVNSDVLLLDTSRITVAGDLVTDLATEQLDGLFQSRPKRGSIFRLGAPIRLGGTWSEPRAEPTESKWVTIGKLVIGLSNPNTIIVLFGDLGTGKQNPCKALLEDLPAGEGNEENGSESGESD